MSACCASATPSGLALAPDLPWEDQPCPGNLGCTAEAFPTPLSLLMPAFSLPACPPEVVPRLLPGRKAPLPLPFRAARRFGAMLSPVYCRRMSTRPVSCYALFEWVAASEPTSWLSGQTHILCHLAWTWGPWRAVWAVSLSNTRLSPHILTPRLWTAGIRSLIGVGRR